MNTVLKGLIGASIALALAGGAQAAGQENASTTAPDKTLNDAKSPTQSTPKAKKTTKAKSKAKTHSDSMGSSGTAGSSGNGSAEGAGTMNGVGNTSKDPDAGTNQGANATPPTK